MSYGRDSGGRRRLLRGLVATPALLLMGMHKATAKTSATTFALTPPVLAASLAAHTPPMSPAN